MKRSMKPLTQLATQSLDLWPRCKNLWTFSLFRTFCFSTVYCVDFFVSSVLRHLWVSYSEDEPRVFWLFGQRRQRCPILTQQKAKRKVYHRKRTAKNRWDKTSLLWEDSSNINCSLDWSTNSTLPEQWVRHFLLLSLLMWLCDTVKP